MIQLVNERPVIKPRTIQGFIQALAGIFRLTPKEIRIFAIILYLVKQKEDPTITPGMREEIATISGYSLQVVTNYINKLRNKKVIEGDKPHFLFLYRPIMIDYEE